MINPDEYSDIGTQWVALYEWNNVTYFYCFGVKHIPKEIKAFLDCSLSIRTILLEYKHTIQQCANIFVLNLLNLCLQERL